MGTWRMTGEASLKDLLGDDIMDPVMRSAGIDGDDLRRTLEELAHRLGPFAPPAHDCSCCGASD